MGKKTLELLLCIMIITTFVLPATGLKTNTENQKIQRNTSFLSLDKGITIYVDDSNEGGPWEGTQQHPYQHIQNGINAANQGDTVLVMDGLYNGIGNRDLDFNGKAILVKSKNGPENCIIDCDGDVNEPHRGFYFHNNEDEDSILEGFTIKNGYAPDGEHGENGGGIYCISSSPTITNNIILENKAWSQGAGICCYYSDPKITYCNFSNNEVVYSGGGIFCLESEPTISQCTFYQNSAGSDGGGISFCWMSHPLITNCNFLENSAGEGGGIFIMYTNPTIKNSLFLGNSATGYSGGGGIQCRYGDPIITNCTITKNSAIIHAGGISFKYQTSATITNCILWNNAPEEIYTESGSPVVTYSDIDGSWTGKGNIDNDPLFIDPENHDYNLHTNSPCINTGKPNWIDPDGTRSDMGTFYFNSSSNNPPNKPTINGYNNGKPGIEYQYTFTTIDPDENNVYYWIDWGDETNSGWIGPYISDEEVLIGHTWSEKGTYVIKAKAKDVHEAESDWTTLTIAMPKNKTYTNKIVLHILKQFSTQQKLILC